MTHDHIEPYVNGSAVWEADEDAKRCKDCESEFTFLSRRHHCRCCGHIFCATCCDNYLSYDLTRVHVIKRWIDDEEYPPFRTCNGCMQMLENRKLLQDNHEAKITVEAVRSLDKPRKVRKSSRRNRARFRDDASESNICPICSRNMLDLGDMETASAHVAFCISRAELAMSKHSTSDTNSNNGNEDDPKVAVPFRMLTYTMRDETKAVLEECPICFEDMTPGDKLSRLNCLCIYHHACIRSWIDKKISLQGDTSHQGNFCPIHDAIL